MQNFTFQNPVKIIFGKGQIAQINQEIPANSKILLTYGGGSIKRNGVYDQVMAALQGYEVHEFAGIEPNPRYETLMKAVAIVKEKKIDFLLSVGGGSALDGTKFIAAAAKYEGAEAWDIMNDWSLVTAAIPLGAVLTLPATGSEMNAGSVVTREATKEKIPFISPYVFPQFSVLDPETTYTLPPHQTANGVIDAFVHVTEQYLTYPVGGLLQDRFSESILQVLVTEGPKVMQDPNNYEARANVMWSATMALNGLIAAGVPQDWAAHRIGHEITAKCGLDHGQTLAIVLPSLLQVKSADKEEKLLQYAERVWGINEGDKADRIQQAIAKTREFFEKLGVKTRLSDYDVSQEDLPAMVASLDKLGLLPLGERQNITAAEVEQILQGCF